MYCENCGKELKDNDKFCENCGCRVKDTFDEYTEGIKKSDLNNAVSGAKNPGNVVIIILIVILGIFILIGSAWCGFEMYSRYKKNPSAAQTAISPTADPTTKTDSAASTIPPSTAKPTATIPPAVNRISSYNASYTYKRMGDIHSSVSASDNELAQMKNLITDYNNAWINYINNNDNTVFNYLRKDTEAYNNAVKYGQKNINESLELTDIQDVRKTNDNYYVWSHEIINEYGDTNKRNEYHWVYQIKKDSEGFYVADYTSDPAYQ